MTRQLINRMIKTGSCTSFASSRVKKGGVQCRCTTTRATNTQYRVVWRELAWRRNTHQLSFCLIVRSTGLRIRIFSSLDCTRR